MNLKMKQILRKTLLLIGVFLGGISSAWADGPVDLGNGTSRLGAEGNTTAWWTDFTEFVDIAPNKTITYTFVNHSSKAENYANWAVEICEKESGYEYLLMRSDCFGLTNGEWSGRTTNDNSTNWFKCNRNDYDWSSNEIFRENLNGATVVMTIKRKNEVLTLIEDVTTADGTKKFRHFFVMDCVTAYNNGETLKARLTVDRAHLIINNTVPVTDSEDYPTIAGYQVGSDDNSTPWWTAFSNYYTLAEGESMKLKFKNYTCKVGNTSNFVAYVTTDADRGAEGYMEYLGMRSDNWVLVSDANCSSNDYEAGFGWDWNLFKTKMDGSTVLLTVTRSGANVTVRADITPSDAGTPFYEEYTKECGNGSQAIRIFLVADGSHFDILPESIEIGATGWGTFASDYNLDFSQAEEGLTAYAVTGSSGSAITKDQITTIVPAGTPLLLNGTAKTYTVPVATTAGSKPAENKLVRGEGNPVSKDGTNTYDRYVLVANGETAKFKIIGANSPTVARNRAYLQLPYAASSSRDILSIDGGDATGINMVNGEGLKINGSEVYYNLQGQRVLYPTKGLYIVNGKKVIVK